MKHLILITIGLIALICWSNTSFAQKKENANSSLVVKKKKRKHSPKKAALLSLVLPGAGQVYNKKYWKVPLVYGSIGTSLYLAQFYNTKYVEFRRAYRYAIDDDETTESGYPNSNPAGLKDIRDTYQRWRDMSYIFAGIFYVLQVADASVDAHLMEFNVDDLNVKFEPTVFHAQYVSTPATGLKLVLSLNPRHK